jgi:hypothetical protein
MIEETRGASCSGGCVEAKPADVAALRQLLVRVSDLVAKHGKINEMDLNPVSVHEKGLTVVDARVVPPLLKSLDRPARSLITRRSRARPRELGEPGFRESG